MLCGVTAYRFQYNQINEYSKIFIEINNLHLNLFDGGSRQNGYSIRDSLDNHIMVLVKLLTHSSPPPISFT